MGYEDLDVVDPTGGEAQSGQEAAVSEVRGGSGARGTPPPPAACNRCTSALEQLFCRLLYCLRLQHGAALLRN